MPALSAPPIPPKFYNSYLSHSVCLSLCCVCFSDFACCLLWCSSNQYNTDLWSLTTYYIWLYFIYVPMPQLQKRDSTTIFPIQTKPTNNNTNKEHIMLYFVNSFNFYKTNFVSIVCGLHFVCSVDVFVVIWFHFPCHQNLLMRYYEFQYN